MTEFKAIYEDERGNCLFVYFGTCHWYLNNNRGMVVVPLLSGPESTVRRRIYIHPPGTDGYFSIPFNDDVHGADSFIIDDNWTKEVTLTFPLRYLISCMKLEDYPEKNLEDEKLPDRVIRINNP